MNHAILYAIAAGLMVCPLLVVFFRRRLAPFYRLYRERVRCGRKSGYTGALEIYTLLLEEGTKMAIRDSRLMAQAEEHLNAAFGAEAQKTLSQQFNYSF